MFYRSIIGYPSRTVGFFTGCLLGKKTKQPLRLFVLALSYCRVGKKRVEFNLVMFSEYWETAQYIQFF